MMLRIEVIKPASIDTKAWSQVMLAIKPNGKWRFCVDCRNLNWLTSATVGHSRVLIPTTEVRMQSVHIRDSTTYNRSGNAILLRSSELLPKEC